MAGKPASLTNRPVAKFLTSLFQIVDEANDDIIGWDHSGTRFIVKDVDRLQAEVLPLHFRSKKFSSTCRQVGMPLCEMNSCFQCLVRLDIAFGDCRSCFDHSFARLAHVCFPCLCS